jgi:hypothetical protein
MLNNLKIAYSAWCQHLVSRHFADRTSNVVLFYSRSSSTYLCAFTNIKEPRSTLKRCRGRSRWLRNASRCIGQVSTTPIQPNGRARYTARNARCTRSRSDTHNVHVGRSHMLECRVIEVPNVILRIVSLGLDSMDGCTG